MPIKEANISAKFVVLGMVECILRADCSIPLHATRSQLLVPFPEEESRISSPIRPFQLEVSFNTLNSNKEQLFFMSLLYGY